MSHIYFYRISCNSRNKFLAAGIILFILSIACQGFGADILFITGTKFHESDLTIQDKLEGWGHNVSVVPDAGVRVNDALENDLVFISESVYSRKLNTTLRNLPVPVIVSEPWLFGDMGLTDSNPFIDFGKQRRMSDIIIDDLQHDLTADLPAGTVSISYRNTAIGWGIPGPNAVKIAMLNDGSARSTIFAYDKDDQMPGLKAPAKRVGFFLNRKTAGYLTPEGWALFKAAVDWSLTARPSMVTSIHIVSDDTWISCAGNDCLDNGWGGGPGFNSGWEAACSVVSNTTIPEEVIPGTEAGFIWTCPREFTPLDYRPATKAYFHRTFSAPSDPSALKVTMDYVSVPGTLTLFINGTQVLSGGTLSEAGMRRPINLRNYLHLLEDENEIAIVVDNSGKNENWILLDIRLEAEMASPVESNVKEALLVVGKTPVRSSDRELKIRLERLGYLVHLIDDDRVAEIDGEDKDLIVISESVWSALVGETFTRIDVPVICFESFLYDDLKMTESSPNKDYGNTRCRDTIKIDLPDHPIAAGARDKVKVTDRPRRLGWAIPLPSSTIIASPVNESNRATIFAYDAGAPLVDGMIAPARRIGMFPHKNSASQFTAAGWDLFDAAVEWATQE